MNILDPLKTPEYRPEITHVNEALGIVKFAVQPPVKFADQTARQDFGREVLLHCYTKTENQRLLDEGQVNITHEDAGRLKSIGLICLPGSIDAIGDNQLEAEDFLKDVLYLALNGTERPHFGMGVEA